MVGSKASCMIQDFVAFGLKYLRVRCKQRELEKHESGGSGENKSEKNTAVM